MEYLEIDDTDFITLAARQPAASYDPVRFPDFAAIADAERADAEAFRIA